MLAKGEPFLTNDAALRVFPARVRRLTLCLLAKLSSKWSQLAERVTAHELVRTGFTMTSISVTPAVPGEIMAKLWGVRRRLEYIMAAIKRLHFT